MWCSTAQLDTGNRRFYLDLLWAGGPVYFPTFSFSAPTKFNPFFQSHPFQAGALVENHRIEYVIPLADQQRKKFQGKLVTDANEVCPIL